MYSVKCIVFIYFYKIEIKSNTFLIFVKLHSPTRSIQNQNPNQIMTKSRKGGYGVYAVVNTLSRTPFC